MGCVNGLLIDKKDSIFSWGIVLFFNMDAV